MLEVFNVLDLYVTQMWVCCFHYNFEQRENLRIKSIQTKCWQTPEARGRQVQRPWFRIRKRPQRPGGDHWESGVTAPSAPEAPGFIKQGLEEQAGHGGLGPLKTGPTEEEKENKTDLGGEQEEKRASRPMPF